MKWPIRFLLFIPLLLVGCSNVEVTLPKALFSEMTEEDLQQFQEEQGFKDATINDDETVSFVMSQDKQQEILKGIEEDIKDSMTSIPKEENSFVTSITANKEFDQFIVIGEEAKFDESFAIYLELSILMNAYYYQFFTGKEEKDIRVHFTYEDTATQKQYRSETYPKQE